MGLVPRAGLLGILADIGSATISSNSNMIALSLLLTVGVLFSVWADHNRRNRVRLTTLEKELELRETKVQLQQITGDQRTLISALDEGLAVCEMIYDGSGTADDYRILEMNKGYEKQTGFKQESVRGKTAREQVHDPRDLGVS